LVDNYYRHFVELINREANAAMLSPGFELKAYA